MGKKRSVNTHFWSDNYVIDLDPIEKLLFLYLLTNTETNMLGIYEIHIRRIAFDTGIDKEMIKKIFKRFEKAGKAKYSHGHVILRNFTDHQSYNTNMEKSALTHWKELPDSIKKDKFCRKIRKALKGFTKGSEGFKRLLKIETKKETKTKREKETKTKNNKQSKSLPKYSIHSKEKWNKDRPIDYKSFIDHFNELYNVNIRTTDKKRENIRARLSTFTAQEIKEAWQNRLSNTWLKDNGYLGDWKAAMRNDEKIDKYLNANYSEKSSFNRTKNNSGHFEEDHEHRVDGSI